MMVTVAFQAKRWTLVGLVLQEPPEGAVVLTCRSYNADQQ